MPMPTHSEISRALLEALKDGQPHALEDLRAYIIRRFNITEQELAEKNSHGRPMLLERLSMASRPLLAERLSRASRPLLLERLSRALYLLKDAGMIVKPQYATYTITQKGLDAISENSNQPLTENVNSENLDENLNNENLENLENLEVEQEITPDSEPENSAEIEPETEPETEEDLMPEVTPEETEVLFNSNPEPEAELEEPKSDLTPEEAEKQEEEIQQETESEMEVEPDIQPEEEPEFNIEVVPDGADTAAAEDGNEVSENIENNIENENGEENVDENSGNDDNVDNVVNGENVENAENAENNEDDRNDDDGITIDGTEDEDKEAEAELEAEIQDGGLEVLDGGDVEPEVEPEVLENQADDNTVSDELSEALVLELHSVFDQFDETMTFEILDNVYRLSDAAFEQFVIDLLSKMGYRAFQNARYTALSGDSEIHGLIIDEKQASSPIYYIHATRQDPANAINDTDLEKFADTVESKGGQGLFVTTAKFSPDGWKLADKRKLLLIDGYKLARLMMANNFCVRQKDVFEVKAFDAEAFKDYED